MENTRLYNRICKRLSACLNPAGGTAESRGLCGVIELLSNSDGPEMHAAVGKQWVTSLARFFFAQTNAALIRRWAGLVLSEIFRSSNSAATGFATLANDPQSAHLPRGLGQLIMAQNENEDLKIVCGMLIKRLVSQGVDVGVLWPADVDTPTATFSRPGNRDWMLDFQAFLDDILPSQSSKSDIIFPLAFEAEAGVFFNKDENCLVMLVQNMLTVVVVPPSSSPGVYIDIPFKCIRDAELHQELELRLDLETGTASWTYLINAVPHNCKEVILRFGNSDDARVALKAIKESHSFSALFRFSSSQSIDANGSPARSSSSQAFALGNKAQSPANQAAVAVPVPGGAMAALAQRKKKGTADIGNEASNPEERASIAPAEKQEVGSRNGDDKKGSGSKIGNPVRSKPPRKTLEQDLSKQKAQGTRAAPKGKGDLLPKTADKSDGNTTIYDLPDDSPKAGTRASESQPKKQVNAQRKGKGKATAQSQKKGQSAVVSPVRRSQRKHKKGDDASDNENDDNYKARAPLKSVAQKTTRTTRASAAGRGGVSAEIQQPETQSSKQHPILEQAPEKNGPEEQGSEKQVPEEQLLEKKLPEKQRSEKQRPEQQRAGKQSPTTTQPGKPQTEKQEPEKKHPEKLQAEKFQAEKQQHEKEPPEKVQSQKAQLEKTQSPKTQLEEIQHEKRQHEENRPEKHGPELEQHDGSNETFAPPSLQNPDQKDFEEPPPPQVKQNSTKAPEKAEVAQEPSSKVGDSPENAVLIGSDSEVESSLSPSPVPEIRREKAARTLPVAVKRERSESLPSVVPAKVVKTANTITTTTKVPVRGINEVKANNVESTNRPSVDEKLARKPNIVSFGRHGPQNQGRVLPKKTPVSAMPRETYSSGKPRRLADAFTNLLEDETLSENQLPLQQIRQAPKRPAETDLANDQVKRRSVRGLVEVDEVDDTARPFGNEDGVGQAPEGSIPYQTPPQKAPAQMTIISQQPTQKSADSESDIGELFVHPKPRPERASYHEASRTAYTASAAPNADDIPSSPSGEGGQIPLPAHIKRHDDTVVTRPRPVQASSISHEMQRELTNLKVPAATPQPNVYKPPPPARGSETKAQRRPSIMISDQGSPLPMEVIRVKADTVLDKYDVDPGVEFDVYQDASEDEVDATPAHVRSQTSSRQAFQTHVLTSNKKKRPEPPEAESKAISRHFPQKLLERSKVLHTPAAPPTDPFIPMPKKDGIVPQNPGPKLQETASRPDQEGGGTSFMRKLREQVEAPNPKPSADAQKARKASFDETNEIDDGDDDPHRTLVEEMDENAVMYSGDESMTTETDSMERPEESEEPEEPEEPEESEESGELTEEMEWESSLRPHQRDMVDVLTRISRQLVRHLIDSETAIGDIIADYERDGTLLIERMEHAHRAEYETQRAALGKARTALAGTFTRIHGQLSDREDQVKDSIIDGLWRKNGVATNKHISQLETVLAGMRDA